MLLLAKMAWDYTAFTSATRGVEATSEEQASWTEKCQQHGIRFGYAPHPAVGDAGGEHQNEYEAPANSPALAVWTRVFELVETYGDGLALNGMFEYRSDMLVANGYTPTDYFAYHNLGLLVSERGFATALAERMSRIDTNSA